MSTIQLPEKATESPSVTYTVMWVDEKGNHVEAQKGLSFKDAMVKVRENINWHGFHSYPAAEGSL